jgi:hypothetical protein
MALMSVAVYAELLTRIHVGLEVGNDEPILQFRVRIRVDNRTADWKLVLEW